MTYEYDAFICHASEDKKDFVRPLAEKLKANQCNLWYDEFNITIGDSLLGKINEGLSKSKYGIVIFSKAFFDKSWPRKELEGLVALEIDGQKKILPVWLDVNRDDILRTYPLLANLFAADTSKGLDYVVNELLKVIKPSGESNEEKPVEPTVFFYDRIAEAFPGIRGLYETTDTSEIIARLAILLKEPLQFSGYYPSFMKFDMRGGTMDIRKFQVLDDIHVLLVFYELHPIKMAAFRPESYWQSFVYMECAPDSPTGLYESSFQTEEYAIFKGEMITREEYDDNCIFRDGKSIETTGAELRSRYVVPNNLVISSRFSPINNNAFDSTRRQLLQGILTGSNTLQDFISEFEKLPKHPHDM